MASAATATATAPDPSIDKAGKDTELSNKVEYQTPVPILPFLDFTILKGRIRHHYEVASDYYLRIWGEHIHHGYWIQGDETKEVAQTQLIQLLLAQSQLSEGSKVLDVGCGVGGTSRYLAYEHGCRVTGVTISGKQVEIARTLTTELEERRQEKTKAVGEDDKTKEGEGSGKVAFLELDAEKMGEYFGAEPNMDLFDCVWISEALSHFPNKQLFFENAFKLLRPGGRLVIADWFKDEGLGEKELAADIKPIEDGMLLPPLCSSLDYVKFAELAGLKVFTAPKDISKQVLKTWDISWTLVQNPALWAFALTQGRDGIAFLQSFRAMRRGFANGSFRYAVMSFEKPGSK